VTRQRRPATPLPTRPLRSAPSARPTGRRWRLGAALLAVLGVLVVVPLLVRARSGEWPGPLAAALGPRPPAERPSGRLAVVGQRGIWIVAASSGARERLTTLPAGQVATQVAWAPDAARLALSQTIYPAAQPLGVGGLYLLPATGGAPTPLLLESASGTQLEQPSWTPDGRGLVYLYSALSATAGTGPVQRIERIGVDDGERTVLVEDALAPALSRDGESLAFVRRQRDGETLWVGDGRAERARELVPERRFLSIAYPRFSPDGTRLAFAATEWVTGGGAAGAREQDAARGARAALGPAVAALLGRLQPHGITAALAPAAGALRPSAHGAPWDLWVVQRDGSGLRRLTTLAEDDASLAWSPDGQWLAFQGTGGLYLVHHDSRYVARLTDRGEAAGIDWAP
jgi:Tol biopolymer transport system component